MLKIISRGRFGRNGDRFGCGRIGRRNVSQGPTKTLQGGFETHQLHSNDVIVKRRIWNNPKVIKYFGHTRHNHCNSLWNVSKLCRGNYCIFFTY